MSKLKDLILPPKPQPGSYYQAAVSGSGIGWIDNGWETFYFELIANIERLESQAVKVCGYKDVWRPYTEKDDIDTHQALLICIEPLDQAVSQAEVITMLRAGHNADQADLESLADRIEKHGIKGGAE